jgi:hypothetical protein
VGAIVRAHQRAQAAGAEIRLATRTPIVLRLLSLTYVDRLVPVFDSVHAAWPADAGPAPQPGRRPGQAARPEPEARPTQAARPEPEARPTQAARPEPEARPTQAARPEPEARPTQAAPGEPGGTA